MACDISNKFQTKRKGYPFPSYCTETCCIKFNIWPSNSYSTHQLYLFLSRHISVLIRILYRKTESIHFSKIIIHKWLVKSMKSLKHSFMHTIQTKRKGYPLPSYCTEQCCTKFNIWPSNKSYYSTHQLHLFLSIRILYRKTEDGMFTS